MTTSPRRVASLLILVSVAVGLLTYTTGGTVCLAHRTVCTPADESALRTFFLPTVVVAGYVLFRASKAFQLD